MKAKKIICTTLAATLSVGMLLTGCGSKLNPNATMIDVNNGEGSISLGLVNFAARYNQATYDQVYLGLYGSTYWTADMTGEGQSMQDSVKDIAIDSLEEDYVLNEHAKDYNVSLSDEEEAKIKSCVEEFLADNDKETLDAMTATEEVVSQYLRYEAVAEKMYTALKEEADVNVSDEDAKVSTISYVFFSTADTTDDEGNAVSLTDEEKQNLYDEASQISEAGNFDLADQFVVNVQSTSFGENKTSTLDDAVISAAKKLSEGQMSGVIEVEDKGYYVVRMDQLYDKEASDTNKLDMIEDQQDDYYQTTLDGWMDETEFTVDQDMYKQIQFTEYFDSMITTDDETEETSESN